ncbi:hypothetical protein CEXT_716171 [Caerostris extrusa]|uniref:Uncharacterized protein n=1 Tax=Caerostris extrusa TaxID=172846 RepID=A0AAV4PW86_CAEEX|nr:hypothetical protein CEXT_716171 [Caerostris extrusa]
MFKFKYNQNELLLPQYAIFARTSDDVNIHNNNDCMCLSGNVRLLPIGVRHLGGRSFGVRHFGEQAFGVRHFTRKEVLSPHLVGWFCVRGEHNFHITLSGNTVLPKGFLSGLLVNSLRVDDFQTQSVEEGADGVLELERIFVQRSSMKVSGFDIVYSIASDTTSVDRIPYAIIE